MRLPSLISPVFVAELLGGEISPPNILRFPPKMLRHVIKTHYDSESQGQDEAGCMRRTSKLFTHSTAVKFVNALAIKAIA